MSPKKSKSKKAISKSKKKFISKPRTSKKSACMAHKVLLDLSDEKLPEFLHFEILLRLNTKELIKNCTLVSFVFGSPLHFSSLPLLYSHFDRTFRSSKNGTQF